MIWIGSQKSTHPLLAHLIDGSDLTGLLLLITGSVILNDEPSRRHYFKAFSLIVVLLQ